MDYQYFKIYNKTFNRLYHIVISKDIERVKKLIKKCQGDNPKDEWFLNAKGLTYCKVGYAPVVWLPEFSSTPQNHAVVAHELNHCVIDTSRAIQLDLCEGSEEAFCYMLDELIEQFYTKIK